MSMRSPRGPSPQRSLDQDRPRSRSRSVRRSRPLSETPRDTSQSPSHGRRDRHHSRTRSPSRGRTRSRSRSRGGRRYHSKSDSRSLTPNQSPPRSSKIVVEKLTKNVTENHIREIFGDFGDIEYLDLPTNKAFMTNRGTAYILYYDPADAEAAIAHMHEAQLDGAILNVSIVLPRRKFSNSPPPASNRGNGGQDTAVEDLQNAMMSTGQGLYHAHDLPFVSGHFHLDHGPPHPDEVAFAQIRVTAGAVAQAIGVMVTAVEAAAQPEAVAETATDNLTVRNIMAATECLLHNIHHKCIET
ncbi:uncharacterized protein N7511_002833 [Penicillium nucicola]|uniref:uncharacterized protein n=1 Tax=Penicillium nucicola TaxID=1850975 RepID=UPI0025454A5F|nr:uncharacterized protein N7511_002833 [Penicillium nucicola]KAJ5770782.1 hypothetical protein N7511_002833 [Penicillium nucicola]